MLACDAILSTDVHFGDGLIGVETQCDAVPPICLFALSGLSGCLTHTHKGLDVFRIEIDGATELSHRVGGPPALEQVQTVIV